MQKMQKINDRPTDQPTDQHGACDKNRKEKPEKKNEAQPLNNI